MATKGQLLADIVPNSNEKVGTLVIKPHQGTTNGEVIATWSWGYTHTSGFSYTWEYNNGDAWISASSGSTDSSHKNALYTPPESAKKIRFSVRPISTTFIKNKVETYYWIVTSPTKVTYNIDRGPYKKLNTPPAPSLSMNMYFASMTVNYESEVPARIRFYLVNDTDKKVSVSPDIDLFYGRATIELATIPNATYRCYCIAIPVLSSLNDIFKLYLESDKSEYSSEVDSLPEGVSIEKIESTSATSVKIIFNRITNADKYDVEYTENINNFDRSDMVNSKSIDVSKRSIIYILLSGLETGKTWFFRVRVSNESGVTNWSNISSVSLGEKPNPPTIWSSTYIGLIDEEVTLYWTHNTKDGSKEIDALLTFEMSIQSGESQQTLTKTQTITVPNMNVDDETSSFSYVFKPNMFKHINEHIVRLKWSAQTKGILNEYSKKSVINTIDFYIKPEINIAFGKTNEWYWDLLDFENGITYTTPGEVTEYYTEIPFTLTSLPLYIDIQVTPLFENHPVECYVSIITDNTYQTLNHIGELVWISKGSEIYSITLNECDEYNVFSFMLLPGNITLENYQRYKILVKAVMDNGLIAEYETYFDVDFETVQYVINAEISYDEDNVSTYIQPYCINKDGTPVDLTYLSVYRKNFDGEFVEIGSNLDNGYGTTIIDPHPTLKKVQYRIGVYDLLNGTVAFSDLVAFSIPETAIVIQWDETWTSFENEDENALSEPVQTLAMLKLPFNVDTSESNEVDSSLVEYIGRRHPVGYYGTQVGQKASLKSDIPYYDSETIYKLRKLSVWTGNVYIREPSGIGYWAKVSVNFSTTHLDLVIPVSIEATRVEGGV